MPVRHGALTCRLARKRHARHGAGEVEFDPPSCVLHLNPLGVRVWDTLSRSRPLSAVTRRCGGLGRTNSFFRLFFRHRAALRDAHQGGLL